MARFAARFLERLGAGVLQLLEGALDLRARVEQIPPRFLPRFSFSDALALANALLSLRDVRDAIARVVHDRGRFLLSDLELLFATLELLDEGGDVALLLREP